MVRLHPESRRERTVVVNLLYILQTTRIDVAGLLAWILKKLTDHPEWRERVRAECTLGEGTLAERIVMETLRLEQSEFLYREVHDDIEVGDHRVPRGWLLRICVRESHRDPAVFEDPETYDPDRFSKRRYGWNEYSPFGMARHACIGRDLTRTIARIFVRELAGGYEWTAVEDGGREACGRHWDHWRPSSRFRIRLTPRPGLPMTSER
jgi:cytochrome P450